jgi:hypothetical protein
MNGLDGITAHISFAWFAILFYDLHRTNEEKTDI